MGYESMLEITNQVKPDKVKEARKALQMLLMNQDVSNWGMKINTDGTIELEEWYGKFYDDDQYVRTLLPFLTNGCWYFTGEDGSKWGYEIEDGKLYNLISKWERGEVIKIGLLPRVELKTKLITCS